MFPAGVPGVPVTKPLTAPPEATVICGAALLRTMSEAALNWKLTVSPFATVKLFQVMTVFEAAVVTVVVLATELSTDGAAPPAETTVLAGPEGKAWAVPARIMAATTPPRAVPANSAARPWTGIFGNSTRPFIMTALNNFRS